MKLEIKKSKPHDIETDVLALFLHQDEDIPYRFKTLDNKLDGQITKSMKEKSFKGELNELFMIPSLGNVPAKKVLLVGIGKKKEYKTDNLRQASATALLYTQIKRAKKLTAYIPNLSGADKVAALLTEGAFLASYKFDKYKSFENDEKPPAVDLFEIAVPGKVKEIGNTSSHSMILAESANYARSLQDLPANIATPDYLAKEAQKLGKKYGKLSIKVLKKTDLKKEKMNAILGVSAGSSQDPRLVVLEYKGGKKGPIVLVGKGVTFDSGGLDIKPTTAMNNMHYDKCGALTVFGIIKAAAELKLSVHLIGLTPLTENLVGASAQKPRDIVKSHSGKTIEIINTDAEGRLIMADTLAYSEKFKPKAIIDLATLTGSCVVALGYVAAGLIGNDEDLLKKIEDAAEQTTEKVWRLPFWDEYKKQMDSEVADVKNTGEEYAGTITAAAFLEKFVPEKTKWAHLDIAGTAYIEKMKNPKPYASKGATGYGVRLLTEVIENW